MFVLQNELYSSQEAWVRFPAGEMSFFFLGRVLKHLAVEEYFR